MAMISDTIRCQSPDMLQLESELWFAPVDLRVLIKCLEQISEIVAL
jgi:hypothetical protein